MRTRLLPTLCLLLSSSSVVHAQWYFNGNAISSAQGAQQLQVIASDGIGGAIIAWQDQRTGSADIYAQRVDGAGVVQWTADGVAICIVSNQQFGPPAIVPDGLGGAIIAWQDQRSGVTDIYAQRINGAGVLQWAANGVAVCTATDGQAPPVIVSDGANGAIVAWSDFRAGFSDIYAQRMNSAGVPQWAADGIPLGAAPSNQVTPALVSDGVGGAIAAWEDQRAGTSSGDVYAQRVNASGVVQWAVNGISVSSATNAQTIPVAAADGAGGAVIAWQDTRNGLTNSDIFIHRVNSAGSLLWAFNGVQLVSSANNQVDVSVCWDNATGAIATWTDSRTGVPDIYAQRVSVNGSAVWMPNGVPVCTAAQGQQTTDIIADGSGGSFIVWTDSRNAVTNSIYAQRVDLSGFTQWAADGVAVASPAGSGFTPWLVSDGSGSALVSWSEIRSNWDVYAQRLEGRYGYWGRPEPGLAAAKDVPSDQGGKVRLNWYASGRDVLNQQLISHYSIWRAIDSADFAAALAAGVPQVKLSEPMPKLVGAAVRSQTVAATEYFWQWIGDQDAIYRSAYSYDAATSFDSTATNDATHQFQIVAHASDSQYLNWPSNVLDARSVDNLAPAAPLFLTASRVGADVLLHWNRVRVPDLKNYSVYRATATGVTPIPVNFLTTHDDTLLVDASAPTGPLYYVVTAQDVHGNEGNASNEAHVSATTGAGNLPPIAALIVLPNHPNPFSSETTLQVGLVSASDVRVEVYDVAGRRVREHTFQRQAKGWRTLRLDGRDRNGTPLPSGVYFYRVHAGAETVTNKMVIAR